MLTQFITCGWIVCLYNRNPIIAMSNPTAPTLAESVESATVLEFLAVVCYISVMSFNNQICPG